MTLLGCRCGTRFLNDADHGTLIAGAYTHHVVRSADGLKIVRKSPGSLDKIYVDTRNWSRRVEAPLPRAMILWPGKPPRASLRRWGSTAERSSRVGVAMFGSEETIKPIVDIDAVGTQGEPLCLAHKTTFYYFFGPVGVSDDGYVLGVRGNTRRYYKMPRGDELTEWTKTGKLPQTLPPYSIPLHHYLLGNAMWIFFVLGAALFYGKIRAARRSIRRRAAGLSPIADHPWTEPLLLALSACSVAVDATLLASRSVTFECALFNVGLSVVFFVGMALTWRPNAAIDRHQERGQWEPFYRNEESLGHSILFLCTVAVILMALRVSMVVHPDSTNAGLVDTVCLLLQLSAFTGALICARKRVDYSEGGLTVRHPISGKETRLPWGEVASLEIATPHRDIREMLFRFHHHKPLKQRIVIDSGADDPGQPAWEREGLARIERLASAGTPSGPAA